MKNTKIIIGSIAALLLTAAASHAQNWQSGYSQNGSYTGPNGRTVSYNNNVTYSQGAGGWMNTGCPQGLGWAIFAINAVRGAAAGQPIPTPTSAGACGAYGGGGGYYNGGNCYGAAVYGQPYTTPTYRAGWGCTPN